MSYIVNDYILLDDVRATIVNTIITSMNTNNSSSMLLIVLYFISPQQPPPQSAPAIPSLVPLQWCSGKVSTHRTSERRIFEQGYKFFHLLEWVMKYIYHFLRGYEAKSDIHEILFRTSLESDKKVHDLS